MLRPIGSFWSNTAPDGEFIVVQVLDHFSEIMNHAVVVKSNGYPLGVVLTVALTDEYWEKAEELGLDVVCL